MGMYTELVLKCRIKGNISPNTLAVLRNLFKEPQAQLVLPDHPFFKCPRWSLVGNSCSYYHHPLPCSDLHEFEHLGGAYIFSRSDLKNYDNEIELFLDWIDPYLDHLPGECIGWTWYEEDEQPTLIFKQIGHVGGTTT